MMKASGIGSRRCPRPSLARIVVVVGLSIIAKGSAFAGIARPMSSLKHRVIGSSSTCAASPLSKVDARTSSRTMPKMTASGEGEVGFVEKVTAAWGTVIEQVNAHAVEHAC